MHWRELIGLGHQVYYKDALGAILVYDISRPQTFEKVAEVSAAPELLRHTSSFRSELTVVFALRLMSLVDSVENEDRLIGRPLWPSYGIRTHADACS